MQTLQLVNKTSRPIDAVYLYPPGAADHGAPRAKLAPNATAQVQVKAGRVEVLAVSAKVELDEHTRDVPSASQDLEVTGPAEVVFYDNEAAPPGLDRPGVFGVAFTQLGRRNPAPEPTSPPPP
jgi:hypothetical protein